ncbi:hypothetical protein D915_007137 [Fasciola hepatica]|uniref:Uncharacterized protein n=1 Tax=Fasciola hepatica TaxID=6192 RepID=A0A4E0R8M9_FASHE|nr:hypothetical protein D915_007137 [Fasciola hepatica]
MYTCTHTRRWTDRRARIWATLAADRNVNNGGQFKVAVRKFAIADRVSSYKSRKVNTVYIGTNLIMSSHEQHGGIHHHAKGGPECKDDCPSTAHCQDGCHDPGVGPDHCKDGCHDTKKHCDDGCHQPGVTKDHYLVQNKYTPKKTRTSPRKTLMVN